MDIPLKPPSQYNTLKCHDWIHKAVDHAVTNQHAPQDVS